MLSVGQVTTSAGRSMPEMVTLSIKSEEEKGILTSTTRQKLSSNWNDDTVVTKFKDQCK